MKNNMIIKAKYNISTIENRIFLLLLYKLQRNDGQVRSCEISVSELKKLIKKKANQNVTYIGEQLETLRTQPIFFQDAEGWGKYGFINGFKYLSKNNSFRIEASNEIHTYISDYLKTGYTPINLAVFFSLSNSNAQRFYDLLRLWSGTKHKVNYTVDELKELLMLEDKYPNFYDFNRRIIKPAIKELNDTGKFKITVQEHKEGKKVHNLDFLVEDLDKRVYFKEKDLKLIEEIVAPEEDKSLNNDEKENTNESFLKEEVKETIDFYVPNKSFFTPKTLETLKEDFKDYDFKDKNNKLILLDAVGTTLDKFNEEKIKNNRYSYFKSTLSNKLKESKNKSEFKNSSSKIDNEKKPPTKFHNFEETYTKYSAEELEDMIERSQKNKYK